MKTLTGLLLPIFVFSGAFAQSVQPAWHATIKVIDEENEPVASATVTIWYYVKPPPGQNEAREKVEGLTDTNGLFAASHENTGSIDLGFQAIKTGYYPTTKGHEFVEFKDGDPSKWNPSETLCLKKVAKPIAMYAKRLNSEPPAFKKTGHAPIVFNKTIGYDFTAGDWVAPYGKGISTDISFTEEFNKNPIWTLTTN